MLRYYGTSIPDDNRIRGKSFEEIFYRHALYTQFYPVRNYQSARVIPGGRLKLIKGQLDFTLVNKRAQVGFFDTKTFTRPYFIYSEIDEAQLNRAISFNDWGVASGFVVWFVGNGGGEVVFYSGRFIARVGPGSRFNPEDGVSLGQLSAMNLGPLFASPGPTGTPPKSPAD